MKNVFRFLGIAFAACSMLVACDSTSTNQFTVNASANDDAMGTVTGGGAFDEGATCTLTATPKDGYVFVNWSDGATENPHTITVTADVNIVANFAQMDGAKVTFGAQSWTAAATDASYYTSYAIAGLRAMSVDEQTYPISDNYFAIDAAGNYTDATSDGMNYNNGVISYVEYYEDSYLIDGNGLSYGDWWAKSMNLNVKTLDLTSMDYSFSMDAVMFDAEAVLVDKEDFATAPTQNMTVNAKVKMTAAKGGFTPKKWSK